jgi:YqjK-like protein
MGTASREELLLRRQRLQSRSEQLRVEWSVQVQVLRAPLGLADQARAGIDWMARNPQWPIAAVLVLVLIRPGRALRWASYGWQGWTMYRRLRKFLPAARAA